VGGGGGGGAKELEPQSRFGNCIKHLFILVP